MPPWALQAMSTTKKLIVTETIHYGFELPPNHPEDHDSLKAGKGQDNS